MTESTESIVKYNIKTGQITAVGEIGKPPGEKIRIIFTETEFTYTMEQMVALDKSLGLMALAMENARLSGTYPIDDLVLNANGEELTWEQVIAIIERISEQLGALAKRHIKHFEENISLFFMAKLTDSFRK